LPCSVRRPRGFIVLGRHRGDALAIGESDVDDLLAVGDRREHHERRVIRHLLQIGTARQPSMHLRRERERAAGIELLLIGTAPIAERIAQIAGIFRTKLVLVLRTAAYDWKCEQHHDLDHTEPELHVTPLATTRDRASVYIPTTRANESRIALALRFVMLAAVGWRE
jgi:hypothetical protein